MRALITRPRSQSGPFAEALHDAGYETAFLPVIEIKPVDDFAELDAAIHRLSTYDWIVFGSVNAVEVTLDRIQARREIATPGKPKVAAIGRKTAEALRERGVQTDFVPDEYVAEAIMPGLGDVRGKRILLPRAEIARDVLPAAIRKAGGTADEISVYRTLPVEPDPEGLAALQAGVDAVTLTSPSTVDNFVEVARRSGLDPLDLPGRPWFICIGPVTEQAAREQGLGRLIVASDHTTDGMVAALLKQAGKLEVQ